MRWIPLLIAACATPAFAQETEREEKGVSPGTIANNVGAGTLDSPVSLLNAIEINAGEEGTNAAIRIGTKISDAKGSFHAVSLTAGAALDKDTGVAFSSLDPFANGVFLEGRYTFTHLFGRRRNPGAAAFSICEEVERSSGVAMEGNCSSDYIATNGRSRYDEFDRLFFKNATVVFAGFTGRVGREGFDFLDPATGGPLDGSRTPWSLGAFAGVSYLPWRNSFAIEMRHQTSFKAAATAAVCPGTPGVTVCPVGPVGPPSERKQDVVTGEFRQRLGQSFAFAVRGSYSFKGNIFELDVPVYFIADAKQGLNAGVRARYVDDPDADDLNEGWVFGVFVSKSFSLFR